MGAEVDNVIEGVDPCGRQWQDVGLPRLANNAVIGRVRAYLKVRPVSQNIAGGVIAGWVGW